MCFVFALLICEFLVFGVPRSQGMERDFECRFCCINNNNNYNKIAAAMCATSIITGGSKKIKMLEINAI